MKRKINYSKYIIFLLFFFSSIVFFQLSKYNFFPVAHGPYYFSFAESMYNNLGIFSYWTIPQDPKLVYTFQIGISFIIYLCILILGIDFWYLLFYFLSSVVWVLSFNQLENFLVRLKFNKYEALFLIFVLFFQPYNLNQIATFSNEVIYYPLIILSFFLFINTLDKVYQSNKKILYFIFLLFFIFGIFFRVHHVTFLASLFIFIIFYQRKYFYSYLIFSFLTLTVFILILYFTPLSNSLAMAKSILFTSLDNLNLTSLYNNSFFKKNENLELGMGYINYETILVSFLDRISNIFTYPILLEKFTNSLLIKCLFLIIFLFFNYLGLRHIKKISINYFRFSVIYLFISILFIYFLPFFELSYVLPISFIFFINLFIVIKLMFKENFFKVIVTSSLIFVGIITIIYSGIIKTQGIEIYGNRNLTENIKKFYIKYPYKNNLFYATSDVYFTFELHYWHSGSRVCLSDISIEECKVKRGIDNYSNIIFLFNENEEILDNSTYKNFLINNDFNINKIYKNEFINYFSRRK